jgi:hypothetical protein
VLRPVPALLDKDTLFAGFVAEVQAAHGRPAGEREGDWYDAHIKVHEYGGMAAATRHIRAAGCPVMLVAPFTTAIRDGARWRDFAASLGGGPVHLVWVSCDPPTLRERIEARGFTGDAGKLADWKAFVARMQPDTPPPVPHLAVDNGAGAAPLRAQVAVASAAGTRP